MLLQAVDIADPHMCLLSIPHRAIVLILLQLHDMDLLISWHIFVPSAERDLAKFLNPLDRAVLGGCPGHPLELVWLRVGI